jgi:phosphatidylglycerol lysyltransferase
MPRLAAVLRRFPLTAGLVVTMLVLSVATRALWDPVATRSLSTIVTYGVPAFESGRWWTVATGALFALYPLQYIPILVGLAAFGGFTEWRLGRRRAAVAFATTHLCAVLGAALLLWATRNHGYEWATRLSHVRDAGPSAGFLGAAAAASVTLSPPWRGRLRAGLAAYVLLFVIHMGALADLEHVFGVTAGLLLGPLLARRAPRFARRPLTRRDFRLLACVFFVIAALEGLIQPFTTADGPLASTLSKEARAQELQDAELLGALVQAVLWFWLARSLYKGRRRAWRWATGLLTLVVAIQLAGIVVMLVGREPGLPVALYEMVGNSFGLGVLYVGRHAFRNPSPRKARRTTGSIVAPADDEQREAATRRLQQEGTVNRLAWMTTWPENRWFESRPYAGYVAYRVHAGVAVGLCDPVAASESDRSRLLAAFADAVHSAGLVPCLFTVTGEASRHASDQGWQSLQIAEEAVIDLTTLSFTGKAWQDVRTAMNQAAKLGITLRLGPLGEQPRGLQLQVRAISSEWVEDKGLPEMGFTLGGVDEALDPHVRVALAVDEDSTVHGLTSWMPIYDVGGGEPAGWTLDVMRRLPGGFRYSMEFLISSAAKAFKDEGCRVVSLSGAPLARSRGPSEGPLMDRGTVDAFLDKLGGALEPYYGFRSLHAFKAKFQPQLAPLYLVFPEETDLPRIGLALSRAYLPDAGVRDLVALARSARSG